MKTLKAIAVAGILAVACMELFSGCSDKPSAQIKLEAAYLAGWNAGIDMDEAIQKGIYTNTAQACGVANSLRKQYLESIH